MNRKRTNAHHCKEGSLTFLLNMQMIVDELEDRQVPVYFTAGDDHGRLSQVNFYHGQEQLEHNCVYLTRSNQLPSILPHSDTISLIVIGTPPTSYYYSNFSLIVIQNNIDLFELYDMVQGVFERNRRWTMELLNILNDNGTIQRLSEIAYDYFKNPVFIHNPQFYIIACHEHLEQMDPWQLDERTGNYMLSTELINIFKTSPVYLETLETENAQIFPEDQLGYRILYVNLWNEFGRYEGRVCIDELSSALRKGQFLALEYFAGIVQQLLQRRNEGDTRYARPFEVFLTNVISRRQTDERQISSMLDTCDWKLHDAYVCFKLELENRDKKLRSMVNTCNHIEVTLQESHAFFYEDSILVVLNLTREGSDVADCVNSLAYIIRDGLLKMGISNVFHNFCHATYCYQQASLALYYGKRCQPTIWIHHYRDYVMQYIFDMACRELPAEFICSDKLMTLRRYDEENNGNFYETLACYMKNGQNAEQTAKELFLHRSTLFYRLKKIKSLTGMDWTSETEREYLQFSLNLMSRK